MTRFASGVFAVLASLSIVSACGHETTDPGTTGQPSIALHVDGRGNVAERFTAEVWVVGSVAYTTTWGARTVSDVRSLGNAIKIWNIEGASPVLVDSLIVPDAGTLGDVQATADNKLLVVATEFSHGSIVIYDLTNPLKPQLVSRFTNANTAPGVHTAEVQRVNGKDYAFLCIDPAFDQPARLVIVDLSNPALPVEVFSKEMGAPFVHDVFVRDGILMTALWDDGISIFDIGGGGKGGSITNPVLLGNVKTVGGKVHNIWWFHDQSDGTKRYAFIGEEGPGSIGASSVGDIHVVDVSDFANPREVGFFHVPGAGPHNFSADEQRGVLYAAYYNAGVRALNVRGNLGQCQADAKLADGRCDLGKMGREVGHALTDEAGPVFVWGIFFAGSKVYASDMLNGLWKLERLQ